MVSQKADSVCFGIAQLRKPGDTNSAAGAKNSSIWKAINMPDQFFTEVGPFVVCHGFELQAKH